MVLTRFDIVSAIIIIILIGISIYHHMNDKHDVYDSQQLGVKSLIEKVKSELFEIEKDRIANNQAALFEVKAFELEIKFVINETRTQSGKVEYEVITIGSETKVSAEKVQTIKLQMITKPPSYEEAPPSDPDTLNNASYVQENQISH